MDNHLTVAQKLHKNRGEILEFCHKYSTIYLYGTGVVGGLILNYLNEENIEISGFIVSDDCFQEESFNGYKIYKLSELINKQRKNEIGIIVAVGKYSQKIILDNIKNIGYIENVYCQKIYFMNNDVQQTEYRKKENNGYFCQYNELDKIGENTSTDKNSYAHNYLGKYEFFLKNLREEKFTLIELGVLKGASLRMWGEYFKNANIIGVDIEKKCLEYIGENRKVIIKDLSIEDNINELRNLSPRVIVDDASHFWSHQIKAIICLFSALPSGGIYIIEDLETSFEGYEMYADASISAYNFCSNLAEVATSDMSLNSHNILKNEIEMIGLEIEMISFIKGACIIIKK